MREKNKRRSFVLLLHPCGAQIHSFSNIFHTRRVSLWGILIGILIVSLWYPYSILMGTFRNTAFLGSGAHGEPIQTSRADLLNLSQPHTGRSQDTQASRASWDDQDKLALLASLVSMHMWPMMCARNGPLRLLLLPLGFLNWVSGVALSTEELKPSCRRGFASLLEAAGQCGW